MTAQDKTYRIVVGVDGSPSCWSAFRWAVRQAQLTGGTVDAVIAWHYPAATGGYGWGPVGMMDDADYGEIAAGTLADTIASTVDPHSDVRIRQLVVLDIPAPALLRAAAGADLLVLGSRGHGGFAGALLGSVSQHCVHHAPCPVVVIRSAQEHPAAAEAAAAAPATL
jgi:nucleotide-binding universal stress UspA family protein